MNDLGADCFGLAQIQEVFDVSSSSQLEYCCERIFPCSSYAEDFVI